MSDYKVQLIFNGSQSQKWSEVYYAQSSSVKPLAAALDGSVGSARAFLLHRTNTLTKAKITDVAAAHASTVVPLGYKGQQTSSDPYPCSVAAVISLGSSVIEASRRLFLRGLSMDGVFRDQNTGVTVVSPTFTTDLTYFTEQMIAANFEIKALARIGTGVNVYSNIVSAAPGANPKQTVLTLDVAPTLPSNMRLMISRASEKDTPRLNGHWQAIKQSGVTVTIPYQIPTGNTLAGIGGVLRPENYQWGAFLDPTLCGFTYLGGRKTSSPNDGSRGARSGKRERLLP